MTCEATFRHRFPDTMRTLALLTVLVFAMPASGQSSMRTYEVSAATASAHARVMQMIQGEDLASRPLGAIVQRLAEHFLGAPYGAGMLDQSDEESLVVDLTAFDCVLYVEAVLALARSMGEGTVDGFAREIESMRYRGGGMSDYCSRLHYFSDWLFDNGRRGTLAVITDRLPGARPFDRPVSFMTANRTSYRGLADDAQLACLAEVQRDINLRETSYVPKELISGTYGQLEPGDVIAITSSIDGLDVAHTGFVYRFADGRTGFIHASTTGEVRLERDLATYVVANRRQTGMMVARLSEVD